jgi:DNA-binding CsgD family transcriptional regulator
LGNNRQELPGTPTRRRTRDVGLRGLLVERERELAAIEDGLGAAEDGNGSTILIQAPAGAGKSRLLTVAGDIAREAGIRVLGAYASELEQAFPFGVALQLFEPLWHASTTDDRASLLDGPARAAGVLLDGGPSDTPSPAEQGYPLIHALFWLARNLASSEPIVMLIDDAHWSDPSSLRFLAYLADRLATLPVALIAAVRQGESAADDQALAALKSASETRIICPGPISAAGVESLVRVEFPEAEDGFVSACARVTHGNPLLLAELLAHVRADQRRPDSGTAARLTDLAPEAIVDSVVARLGTMPAAARTLACAVSVLGDGASLHHAARLAGLDLQATAEAGDRLAETHMLRAGAPLSFVHPLIRSAVEASLSPLARGHAHRRAATILREDGCPPETVAAHLLISPAADDQDAIETLHAAADKALASGSADSAVRLLTRALAERPRAEARPELLATLAQAEALEDMPGSADRLTEAIRLTRSPPLRAKYALAQGRAHYARGSYEEAAEVLDHAMSGVDLEDGEIRAELSAAYVSAASLVPDLTGEASIRRRRLVDELHDPPTDGQRAALAHVALQAALVGEPRPAVSELVERAWGDGALLESEATAALGLPLLSGALLFADELERDVQICDAALDATPHNLSPIAFATASCCRAWPLYEQGRIVEAAADGAAGLDSLSHSQPQIRTAYGALACCHIQRGSLEQAERMLMMVEDEAGNALRHPFLLEIRAQLRLAQHRPQEALEDAVRSGQWLHSDFGASCPGATTWRSTAALAHLALGEADRATELAAEELEQAKRIGITRVVIRDLRVLGLAAGGKPGIALLTEAVHVGETYPQRLEYIRALVDLGAALRRANRRAEARAPLRKGLELSHRGDATALAERARIELAATGARPRRVMLTGVDSLTPSERRVADLAAQGLTTRQIAQALFVTPKTVEYHLRHTYQKLDVSSRSELAEELSKANPQDVSG